MTKFSGKRVRRYGPKSFQASETTNPFYPELWTKDAYQSSTYDVIASGNGQPMSFDVCVDLGITDINGFHDRVSTYAFEGHHRILHCLISNRTGMIMKSEVLQGEDIDKDYLIMSVAATHIEQIALQKSNPYMNLLQHIICPCYS